MNAMCLDGNEPEEIAAEAEGLLVTATRLRRRIVELKKKACPAELANASG